MYLKINLPSISEQQKIIDIIEGKVIDIKLDGNGSATVTIDKKKVYHFKFIWLRYKKIRFWK